VLILCIGMELVVSLAQCQTVEFVMRQYAQIVLELIHGQELLLNVKHVIIFSPDAPIAQKLMNVIPAQLDISWTIKYAQHATIP